MPTPWELPRELWEHVFHFLHSGAYKTLEVPGPIEPENDWRHRTISVEVPLSRLPSALLLVCRDWNAWLSPQRWSERWLSTTQMSESSFLRDCLHRNAAAVSAIRGGIVNDELVDEVIRVCTGMLELSVLFAVWRSIDVASATLAMAHARRNFQENVAIQELLATWLEYPLLNRLPLNVGSYLLQHVGRILHNRVLHEVGWDGRKDLRREGSLRAVSVHLHYLVQYIFEVDLRGWQSGAPNLPREPWFANSRTAGQNGIAGFHYYGRISTARRADLFSTLEVREASAAGVIRFLEDPRPAARHLAALIVGRRLAADELDAAALDAVLKLLAHRLAPIRRSALNALGKLNPNHHGSVLAVLPGLLGHAVPGVRATALAAVAKLDAAAGAPVGGLEAALAGLMRSEDNESVQATYLCVHERRQHQPGQIILRRERLDEPPGRERLAALWLAERLASLGV